MLEMRIGKIKVMGANMKNLVMPIIIGIIFCMLFGYTDKGQRSVAHYQIASNQIY